MSKIIIIKTGAAGDVVRTTVLLNVLPGKITWVTDNRYAAILPGDHPAVDRIIDIEKAGEILKDEQFDITISLEEDQQAAILATTIQTKKRIGIFWHEGKITYTPGSACWFDMSLISQKNKAVANELKKNNTKSFQQLLFRLLDLIFNAEPYCIYRNNQVTKQPGLVGIETRSGSRWPNKAWSGYSALIKMLERDGYHILLLEQKKTIRGYMDEIARCSFFISGDTLAMHIALAYQIPSLAIFNCTSPAEIYDYGTLKKIVSPLLMDSFYSRSYSQKVVDSISAETVYAAFTAHAAKFESVPR